MKTKIKHFLQTINVFKKIANKKIKIKYFILTLIILLLLTLTGYALRSIKAKNGALNGPQTILIKQDSQEEAKPENQTVQNNSIILTIEYGKNIFTQFTDNNFSPDEVRQVINEMNLHYDLRKLKPGQQFNITFDSEFFYEEKIIKNLAIEQDKKKNNQKNSNKKIESTARSSQGSKQIDTPSHQKIFEKKEKRKIKHIFFKDFPNNKKIFIQFNEDSSKYETRVENSQVRKEIKLETIVIKNSIFADAISKISSQAIYKILNEYAFSVDFQRDIQKNDILTVLMEYNIDEDGNRKDEKILYANLILNKKNNEIFRFKDSFYNKDGKSSSKSLLLSPVDGARISSRFASKRMHPVLGYSRAHLGIDFAAPIGTPIYASGDGVVTFVGWKGGYGKMVSIRHNSEFGTNYGHMSRYSKSAKIGTRVKQREIIGYIGITGLSSGPHLHYELVRNGKKINPRSIKGIASKKLNNQEMKEFKQKVLEIEDLKIKS